MMINITIKSTGQPRVIQGYRFGFLAAKIPIAIIMTSIEARKRFLLKQTAAVPTP